MPEKLSTTSSKNSSIFLLPQSIKIKGSSYRPYSSIFRRKKKRSLRRSELAINCKIMGLLQFSGPKGPLEETSLPCLPTTCQSSGAFDRLFFASKTIFTRCDSSVNFKKFIVMLCNNYIIGTRSFFLLPFPFYFSGKKETAFSVASKSESECSPKPARHAPRSNHIFGSKTTTLASPNYYRPLSTMLDKKNETP